MVNRNCRRLVVALLGTFAIFSSISSEAWPAGQGGRPPIVVRSIIRAPLQTVWQQLVDFEDYGRWNDWVVRVEGQAVVGARVRAFSRDGVALDLEVSSVVPHQELCWVDVTWFTHFGLGGWRCRTLLEMPAQQGVLLTQTFEYSGVFAGVLDRMTRDALFHGMTQENESLRRFLEQEPLLRD